MIQIDEFQMKRIAESGRPVYLYGASMPMCFKLLQYFEEHAVKLSAVYDEAFLLLYHLNKYENFRREYDKRGILIQPPPNDIRSISPGIVIVACAERQERKWMRYFGAENYHTVFSAFDIIFYPNYLRCVKENRRDDLLLGCRSCVAAFRSCPVRSSWYERRNLKKPQKVLRHIAVKAGYVCNLKCEYCCEFLPHFDDSHKKPFDADGVISDIKKLSESLEYIKTLSFSGGDVMLNRQLAKVIRETVRLENVGEVYALTNGTYVLHDDVLRAIEENNERVRIVINNYDINAGSKELQAQLKKREISYQVRDNNGWYDFSDLSFRGRTVEELKALYQNCSFDKSDGYYYIMMEGKLNLRCGVANGMLYYLHKWAEFRQDWIDTRQLSGAGIPAALSALEDRAYLDICNYCAGCSEEKRTQKAAEVQL